MALTEEMTARAGTRHLRRFGAAMMTPERLIAVALAALLALLVLAPLAELIRETFSVQPYDKAYLPGEEVGSFTTFHYERVFSGRMSSALFYKPFVNSLITAFGATVLCLLLGASLAWVVVRTNVPFRETVNHHDRGALHAAVLGDGAGLAHLLQE